MRRVILEGRVIPIITYVYSESSYVAQLLPTITRGEGRVKVELSLRTGKTQ